MAPGYPELIIHGIHKTMGWSCGREVKTELLAASGDSGTGSLLAWLVTSSQAGPPWMRGLPSAETDSWHVDGPCACVPGPLPPT